MQQNQLHDLTKSESLWKLFFGLFANAQLVNIVRKFSIRLILNFSNVNVKLPFTGTYYALRLLMMTRCYISYTRFNCQFFSHSLSTLADFSP